MKRAESPRDRLARGIGKARRWLSFWRRAIVVFVVAAIPSVPFALTRPRAYKSETVVLYLETIRSAELTGPGAEGMPDSARRVGARLREALMSRASLEPIVLDLGLYASVVEQRGVVDAVEEMRKHVTFRAREGDTFEIAFEGTSPDEVQEVTRRLGESIVKEAASRRTDRARTLKEFVDGESERNKAELKAKEAALASFLAVHPEFKRRAGSDLLAAPADTSTAHLPLASLEQRAAYVSQRIAHAGRERPVATTTTVRAPEVATAPPDVLAARRDLADKLARFTDRHPDVLAARARLRAAENAHAAAAAERAAFGDAPAGADDAPEVRDPNDQEALKEQLVTLQRLIAAHRAAGSPAPAAPASAAPPASGPVGSVDIEVEFRRLLREVHDARERQRLLDETQFKASITASSVMNDRNIQVSVLDQAYRPTHSVSRPRSVLLGAALLLCLTLALLAVGLSAWLDDRIHDRQDLAELEMMPLLAVIPRGSMPSGPKLLARGTRE